MSAIPDVRVTHCPDPVCAVRLVGTMTDLIEAVNVHLKADPHGAITPADWKTEPATGQDLTNWLMWQQIEATREAVQMAGLVARMEAAQLGATPADWAEISSAEPCDHHRQTCEEVGCPGQSAPAESGHEAGQPAAEQ